MKYLNLFVLMLFTMLIFCGCRSIGSVEHINKTETTTTITTSSKTETTTTIATSSKTEISTTITALSGTKMTITAITIPRTLVTDTTETTVTTSTELQTTYNATTNVIEKPVSTDTSNSAKDLIKNGLFYCRYTVKEHDGWDSLYTDYWVTKEQICAFNGINPNEYLQVGWIIYIPLDTYVPPNIWDYDYEPVFDENYIPNDGNSTDEDTTLNGVNDDGLVWKNSVILYTKNSEWGSWQNIKLSASILDGFELGPGESFSWFSNVGACQYEDGFVDGGALVEGGSAPGGGICFTSTGLMQGARGAGCVITEKYDHIKPVSYAVPGDEASVSWGYQDLKFYNPSQTTGLQFNLMANENSQSITVTASPYYPY